MKTKEELKEIKKEVETLNKKLAELSEDELKEVVGGNQHPYDDYFSVPTKPTDNNIYEHHFYYVKK